MNRPKYPVLSTILVTSGNAILKCHEQGTSHLFHSHVLADISVVYFSFFYWKTIYGPYYSAETSCTFYFSEIPSFFAFSSPSISALDMHTKVRLWATSYSYTKDLYTNTHTPVERLYLTQRLNHNKVGILGATLLI